MKISVIPISAALWFSGFITLCFFLAIHRFYQGEVELLPPIYLAMGEFKKLRIGIAVPFDLEWEGQCVVFFYCLAHCIPKPCGSVLRSVDGEAEYVQGCIVIM